MVRRLSPALLLCAALGAHSASAQEWPDDLYAASVLASAHWGGGGLSFGVGLKASWTRLRALLPTGADLEVEWIIDRWAVRFSPAVHVYPDSLLSGNACQRTQQVRGRGNKLGFGGPGFAVAVGPRLELGAHGVDWGGALGAAVSAVLFDSHLRGTWLSAAGPELELGAGLRLPSIVGDEDIGILCR